MFNPHVCCRTELGSALPAGSEADLLTPSGGEGNYSLDRSAPHQGNEQRAPLQRPELCQGFPGRVKTQCREGAAGCGVSSSTVLGLVSIKGKGQASSAFGGLRACVSSFHRGAGGCASGRNKSGMCVLPLSLSFREQGVWSVYYVRIYSPNCYQFLGPIALLCFCVFTLSA